MRVQEHLDKISWSIADKMLYFGYGFVMLFQMQALAPSELGLFALTISLHTWIFVITDAFALQSIIQFGMVKENERKVNTIALILHFAVIAVVVAIVFILAKSISEIFSEPRFIEIAAILPIFCLVSIPRTYCVKFIFQEHKMKNLFLVNLALFGLMTGITIYLLYTQEGLVFSDMLIIYFAGHILSSIVAILLTTHKLKFGLKGIIKFKEILKFSFPILLTNSLHSLPKQMDIYIVQAFFSTSVTGIYFSAKNLFRVFEETLNAANGLVYPAAVRQIQNKNEIGLKDLMTKAISFLLIGFAVAVIILQFGLTELIITTFLPEQYYLAIPQFNIMLFAAVGMPLVMFSLVIIAEGRVGLILGFVSISLVFSLIAYYIAGITQNENLIPIGVIVYNVTLGSLCFVYCIKKYGFRIRSLFRAIPDSLHYLKSRKGN